MPSKEPRAAVERPKIPPNVYVLRDVHDGVAVVEDRTGLHEVVPGEVLAGIGRVESIERRGRRWVVVTSNGLIDSDPYLRRLERDFCVRSPTREVRAPNG